MSSLVRKKFKNLVDGLDLIKVLPAVVLVEKHRIEMDVVVPTSYPFPNEMMLRVVSLGFTKLDEVSNFLGIEKDLASDFLWDEVSSGKLKLANGGYKLTASGKNLLRDFLELKIKRTKQNVGWDTLKGTLEDLPYENRSFEELQKLDENLVLLPQVNPSKPNKKERRVEFALEQINTLLGKRENAIRLIEQNRIGDRFAVAIVTLLVFSDAHRSEVEFRVILGSEEAQDYRDAVNSPFFIENVDITVEPQIREDELSSEELIKQIKKFSPEDYKKLGEIVSHIDVSDDEADALVLTNPDDKAPPYQARQFSVYEHSDFLQESLRTASKRLMIISPWITKQVVNDAFLARLEELLVRGVEVDIIYGIQGDDRSSAPVINRLCNMSDQHSNFRFYLHENNHSKVLLVDHTVITTSFNWLSFRGDSNRTFRREEGTLIQGVDYSNSTYSGLQKMIFEECSPATRI
jgi:hypothetical protein